MIHSFDIDIAKEHGIDRAVIIHNLAFWHKTNQANERNYFDGKYWTFNSSKAFHEIFPYFSQSKIKRILGDLEDNHTIVSGVYNKHKFDRTKWYAIIDESVLSKYDIHHCLKMDNATSGSGPTIPDSKPDSKPDTLDLFPELDQSPEDPPFSSAQSAKPKTKPEIHWNAWESTEIPENLKTDRFLDLWKEWATFSYERKKYFTTRSLRMALKKFDGFTVDEVCDAIENSIASNYQGIFPKKAYAGAPKAGQVLSATDYDHEERATRQDDERKARGDW